MSLFRFVRPILVVLSISASVHASDTVLRLAPNTAPPIAGPTFTLTLTGVDSYLGVAATAGSGVAGSASGDLFLRTNQKVLISTNSGTSAALTVDPAGNLTTPGSMTATSFVGSVTNFSGPLAGDVIGTQGVTQVAFVGGQSAANVASGVQAANAATSANTADAIAKRDRSGQITVGSIRFADGTLLSSASLRKYYLTPTGVTGDLATTACAAGFHMASVWELTNLSVLSYDTTRGYMQPDSGSGPPVSTNGWVRTGNVAVSSSNAGAANCVAWTGQLAYGTVISLPTIWFDSGTEPTSRVQPWQANLDQCTSHVSVWCIQD